jgi:hypothetical protein
MSERYSMPRITAKWDTPRGWFLRSIIHIYYGPPLTLRQWDLAAALYRHVREDIVATIVHFDDSVSEERRVHSINERGNKSYLRGYETEHADKHRVGKLLLPFAQRAVENNEVFKLKDIEVLIARVFPSTGLPIKTKRQEIKPTVKIIHDHATTALGGMCPHCSKVLVSLNCVRIAPAEYDHYISSQLPDLKHTWLLCKPCHLTYTTGITPRLPATTFELYQSRLKALINDGTIKV